MNPYFERRGHAALRRGRSSMSGWCYLVTTVTADREPWFSGTQVAAAVAARHGDDALFRDAVLLAWVLMPDHWHGIVRLGDHISLSALMNRFKTSTAISANRVLRREGRLWARGFHDRALRHDGEVEAAMGYVLRNPVRAGLCRCVGTYPWMGCYLNDESRR
ncbi:MAG: transposase [Xanthomonadales bacterium]|nr:transposase [Xanthomonadales bacterium]